MSKKTLEINEAKARAAGEILGTRTLPETVDRALDGVLAVAARRRTIDRLRRMDGLDLDKSRVMAAGWHRGVEIPDAAPD